jgi:uncharacterized membrane protein YbhN (UPF0104 family)
VTPLIGIMQEIADAAGRIPSVDGRLIALAVALQLLTLAFRALAWRNVLAAAYPKERVPVFSIGCAYAAGVGANAFLPARGGEGVKVALARTQIPSSSIPTIAGSLSLVLLVDMALGAALVGALWATGVLPALPALPVHGRTALLAAVGVVLVLGALLVIRPVARVVRRIAANVAQGAAVLRSPRTYVGRVLPFQLGAWGCRIGVVYVVLQAFGIEAGLSTALLVVVLNGAATAVPVPGGAGSQQVLATYALQGVLSAAGAVSFSLSMQVGITTVNIAIGLVAAMILFKTFHPVAALRTPTTGREG